MQWFIIKLVFAIKDAETMVSTAFETSVRLVKASDSSEAFAVASQLGNAESGTLTANKHWQFEAVAWAYPIETPQHGTEVYFSSISKEEAERLTEFSHLC